MSGASLASDASSVPLLASDAGAPRRRPATTTAPSATANATTASPPSAIFNPPAEVWNRVSATTASDTPADDAAPVNAPATAGRVSPSTRTTSRDPAGEDSVTVVAAIPLTSRTVHGPPGRVTGATSCPPTDTDTAAPGPAVITRPCSGSASGSGRGGVVESSTVPGATARTASQLTDAVVVTGW